MNVLWFLIGAFIFILLGYRFYSSHIARILGEDKDRNTPAIELQDGVDYCPTKSPVVFAHHFASIAGAGPILGPTMALMYGTIPVWLWVVIGGIFFGAVHDYVTLFVSIRQVNSRNRPKILGRYRLRIDDSLYHCNDTSCNICIPCGFGDFSYFTCFTGTDEIAF